MLQLLDKIARMSFSLYQLQIFRQELNWYGQKL